MYSWRGFSRFWEPTERLSVLEIINYGTLDLRLAALLWLMMEHRASVIVGAGPSFAGKSTTLNVMLDFLPPEVEQVELQGVAEDFGFLQNAVPARTYMVAAEFNNYMGYVWGDVARRAFQLLEEGYGLGGTVHARTAKEAASIFYRYLGLPLPAIFRLDAIVNLRIIPGRTYSSEPVRQIEAVTVPLPGEDGLTLETIAYRPEGDDGYEFAGYDRLQAVFAEKFSAEDIDFSRELKTRSRILEQLMTDGKLSHLDVRQAVVDFYEGRQA